MAEHALSMALNLAKKISFYDRLLRKGETYTYIKNEKFDKSYQSSSLMNANVGIIGLGNIGIQLMKILKGFNPNIYVIKRNMSKLKTSLNYTNLDDLLSKSSYIFICLPLTHETESMIGERELEIMSGSYLINVGRAKIIDQKSLYNALKTRKLRGAALDVWYKDYLKDNPSSLYPFNKLENVVLSPHRAAYNEDESTHLLGVVNSLLHYNKKEYHFAKLIWNIIIRTFP